MSQTLAAQDPAASRGDFLVGPLIGSWEQAECDVVWVQVAGELDIATAPALGQALRGAGLRARLVVLDLRELTFTDSCGVHVISEASLRARSAGGRMVLVRGPSQPDRILTLTTADALEIVDLDPGEPVVQALLHLTDRPGGMA